MKTNKSLLIGLLALSAIGLASCSFGDDVRGWFEKSEEESIVHPTRGQAGHFYLVGDSTFTGNQSTAWKVQGGFESTKDETGTDLAQFLNVKVKDGSAVKIMKFVDGENDVWYGNLGANYDFASVTSGNITFSREGTYNFFLNSQSVVYLTAVGA